jgi:hypothetical protein
VWRNSGRASLRCLVRATSLWPAPTKPHTRLSCSGSWQRCATTKRDTFSCRSRPPRPPQRRALCPKLTLWCTAVKESASKACASASCERSTEYVCDGPGFCLCVACVSLTTFCVVTALQRSAAPPKGVSPFFLFQIDHRVTYHSFPSSILSLLDGCVLVCSISGEGTRRFPRVRCAGGAIAAQRPVEGRLQRSSKGASDVRLCCSLCSFFHSVRFFFFCSAILRAVGLIASSKPRRMSSNARRSSKHRPVPRLRLRLRARPLLLHLPSSLCRKCCLLLHTCRLRFRAKRRRSSQIWHLPPPPLPLPPLLPLPPPLVLARPPPLRPVRPAPLLCPPPPPPPQLLSPPPLPLLPPQPLQ